MSFRQILNHEVPNYSFPSQTLLTIIICQDTAAIHTKKT